MYTKRVLSGMRPTGSLHLGHYHGVLKNWLELQVEYECLFFVADWHALTTHYDNPEIVESHVWDMVIDWLAAGIDPNQATLFIQSKVPEHAELHLLLSMCAPLGWLERVPSFKDQQSKINDKDLSTYGFLGYPLLQAADILIFDSNVVPVGKDQKQHLELTRDVAQKFNDRYGEDLLVIPSPQIREATATVPGLDGQKMSKSYDNTIEIFGAEKPLRKKVMRLVMDSRPPEEPKPDAEKNIAIQLLKLFATKEVASETENKLREGGLGYGDLKKTLFEHYWEYFTEARAKRAELENNLDYVNQVLQESAEKARALASTVVDRAKKNCGLS